MSERCLWICDSCEKRIEFDKFDEPDDWRSIGAVYCPTCWEVVLDAVSPTVTALRKADKVCDEHPAFTFSVINHAVGEVRIREAKLDLQKADVAIAKAEEEKDEKAVQA